MYEGTIYFGPCKKPMRPKMNVGDYIFGISPSSTRPRRVVFAARIHEKMAFADAYRRYPKLRGPTGPIHVRPARIPGPTFPESEYEHIPGANHAENWRSDISTRALDAFFVCEPAKECLGRWLGPNAPAVAGSILDLLKSCSVHGNAGLLSNTNAAATEDAPVRHLKLYTGLHLETSAPDRLLSLVCDGMSRAPFQSVGARDVKPNQGKRRLSRKC